MADFPSKTTPTSQPPPQMVGMTMEQVAELIKSLKEPSEEEKQKKLELVEQKKEFARQSRTMAEQELTNRQGLQQRCNHRNERYHTWVGNVHGDGNAVALCQICREDYKWRAPDEQKSQGLNLLELRGLTKQHLLQWEKQYPATGEPPDRIKMLMRAGKNPVWPG